MPSIEYFDTPNIQKEIFPHKYYTLERLIGNYDEISKASEDKDDSWIEKNYELFRKIIKNIIGFKIDENHFDMWKYYSFYCK